jgi:hypothetical protein
MQIARLLAKKIALTLGVASPLLSGIAAVSINMATVPAASVVAPPAAMAHYSANVSWMAHY